MMGTAKKLGTLMMASGLGKHSSSGADGNEVGTGGGGVIGAGGNGKGTPCNCDDGVLV